MKKKKIIAIFLLLIIIIIIINPFRKKINPSILEKSLLKNNYELIDEYSYEKIIKGLSENDYHDDYSNNKNSETYKYDLKNNTISYQKYYYNNNLEISEYVLFDVNNNKQTSHYSKSDLNETSFVKGKSTIDYKKENKEINTISCETIRDDYNIKDLICKDLTEKTKQIINEYSNLIKK